MFSVVKASVMLSVSLFASASSAVTVDSYFVESSSFISPGYSAGQVLSLANSRVKLADAGSQSAYMQSGSASPSVYGLWRYNGVQSNAAALINLTGSVGPGRTSASEVFFPQLTNDPFLFVEQGANGQIVFSGRAGEQAGGSSFATQGVWLNNETNNREIARAQTLGALGPGINGGLMFENSSSFVRQMMFNQSGRLAMYARVGTSSYSGSLLQYNGNTWSPCALNGDTSSALGPNYGNTTFDNFSLSDLHAMTPSGRIFGVYSLNSGSGVWELCNGNPRPMAVRLDTSNALNPGLGANSQFTNFNTDPVSFGNDAVVVQADARENSGASSVEGLFLINGVNNRPIAMLGRTDALGPQLPGSSFVTLSNERSSNNNWFAFRAVVAAPSGNITGYFRYSESTGIQPVALIRTGLYSPNATSFWDAIYAHYIAPNGDMFFAATTCTRAVDNLSCASNSFRGEIWKVALSGATTRLLGPGDTVRAFAPSSPGNIYTATIGDVVLDFIATAGSHESNSRDNWISNQGVLIARVFAQGSSTAHHVRLNAFDPNLLLRDGFENP